MIGKLNKLADMPESFSFSFQSSENFMSEEQLQEQIALGNVDPERDIEEVDLEDKEHAGVFTGAKNDSSKPKYTVVICVGFEPTNQHTFVW